MDAPSTSLERRERGIHALWFGAGGAGVTEPVLASTYYRSGQQAKRLLGELVLPWPTRLPERPEHWEITH